MAAKTGLELKTSDLIAERLAETGNLISAFARDKTGIAQIEKIAQAVIVALQSGRRVLIFGNGGSASDAQHFAAELVGGYTKHNRPPLDVLALNTNTSNLTAIGNDYSYEEVFSRQVEAHARKGDVVIGLSTSGNSANVLAAVRKAKELGAITVGMTNSKGGKLKEAAGIVFCSNSPSTPRTQELHIAAIHAICELAEQALFPS